MKRGTLLSQTWSRQHLRIMSLTAGHGISESPHFYLRTCFTPGWGGADIAMAMCDSNRRLFRDFPFLKTWKSSNNSALFPSHLCLFFIKSILPLIYFWKLSERSFTSMIDSFA